MDVQQIHIGTNSKQYSRDETVFLNFSNNQTHVQTLIEPLLKIVCSRLESTYKSPTHIEFLSSGTPARDLLVEQLQFDDVCLQLLHIQSNTEIIVVINVKLIRTLLIRLLATSLIEETDCTELSATEKGIASFVISRLLFDLKNAIKQEMPQLKLTGIYHKQDSDAVNKNMRGFGVYNFSCTFAAEIFPIAVFIPQKLFLPHQTHKQFTRTAFLLRCGHIKRTLAVRIKTISIAYNTLCRLRCGDLIIFDHAVVNKKNGSLQGTVAVDAHDLFIQASLFSENGVYRMTVNSLHDRTETKDSAMEEVLVTSSNTSTPLTQNDSGIGNNIVELTQNVRVSVSVELSRIPMSLQELASLQAGEIIELHRKIEDPLELVVDGKVIGFCHPVQIDGRLGIRITRMCDDDAPVSS